MDKLIDILNDKEVNSEFIREIAHCAQFVLVCKVTIDKKYINLLLDVILSLFYMSHSPQTLIFSLPYYYEYYVWMYLLLQKYEPDRIETAEIYKVISTLLCSDIVLKSEKNRYQQLSIDIFKRNNLKKIRSFYKLKIEKILKYPITMPIINFEEICICLYLDIVNITEYMKQFFFAYICLGNYVEYKLCDLFLNNIIDLEMMTDNNFMNLFIRESIERR